MTGFHFRPALKSEVKPLIGLYAESGRGKTYSALLLAKGYAGDMSLVGMIETESGRGEIFADDPVVGGYQVLSLREDFAPRHYGAAIDAAGKAGLKVLIVDSSSHEWEGAGGVLSMAAKNEEAGKKGMLVWQIPKLSHQRDFVLKLLSTPVPLVIVCMRAKYPMEEVVDPKDKKKKWMRSEVLEPKQADDILFEMTVHAWIDQQHRLHITKCSESGLNPVFIDGEPITVETGQKLAKWSAGMPVTEKPEVDSFYQQVINACASAQNKEELKLWAEAHKEEQRKSPMRKEITQLYTETAKRFAPGPCPPGGSMEGDTPTAEYCSQCPDRDVCKTWPETK